MSHYTKEQVKQILENAPEGTTPAGVVQALRLEGHTLEGHDGAEKPDSFLKRLQLSFGTKEEQASRVEPKGFMKGGLAEIPRDIADVAGKALPLVGMMAGGAGGTVAGVPTGPGAVASGALGAAAGAAGGEALRQTIGRAIGVQRDQETGKMISIAEGAKGVGIEGAIGATAELGGRAIAPTFNWLIAKPLKNVAGIVGGYSKEMLERIFKRPKETTRAILDAAKDGGAADKMVDAAKLAATKMKNVLQVSYKNNLKKVQEKYGNEVINPEAIEAATAGVLDDFRVIVDGKINLQRFSTKEEKKIITSTVNLMKNWKDWTVTGLDDLASNLEGRAQIASVKEIKSLFGELKRAVTSDLYEKVPELAKTNSEYSVGRTLYEQIIKDLNLGKKTSKQTAINKLATIFDKKGDYYQGLVEGLGKDVSEELFDDVIALTMHDWLPQGTLRKLVTAGAAVGGGLSSLPATAATAAVASPRIAATVAAGAGMIKNKLEAPVRKFVAPVVKSFFKYLGGKFNKSEK